VFYAWDAATKPPFVLPTDFLENQVKISSSTAAPEPLSALTPTRRTGTDVPAPARAPARQYWGSNYGTVATLGKVIAVSPDGASFAHNATATLGSCGAPVIALGDDPGRVIGMRTCQLADCKQSTSDRLLCGLLVLVQRPWAIRWASIRRWRLRTSAAPSSLNRIGRNVSPLHCTVCLVGDWIVRFGRGTHTA
jgi:hypothetical protein